MSSGHRSVIAPLMLVLTTAFWSLSFPTMKALSLAQQAVLPEASTWFLSSLCMVYRFGLAALVMVLWCGRSLGGLTRLEVEEGVGLGVFASIGLVLQMDGLAYTHASTSAFLTQCYCIIIPVWVAVVERRWPGPIVGVSCLLVVLGVAVLSRVDWREFTLGRGEIETILASVVFTGQILWLQRPKYAPNRVNHFTAVMFAVISLACVPPAVLTTARASDWVTAYAVPGAGLFLALLVVICTLGGYLLMNAWQPRVTATEAGLIYCAEPVFASVLALFLPAWLSVVSGVAYANERLTSSLLVGGGLITAANLLIHADRRRPAAAEPDRAQ
ncbi:MAG TPA: DMT family transporter [Verrucomicrobiota bacterium]|nr:DMT family transporter [Verrucomicrobiota bacterium]HNU52875.1 DMT family transporter [Verrucomicrobiota bacterium]